MISFLPTDDEIAFIAVAKTFANDKVRPLARVCEANRQVDEKLIHDASELGLLQLELPEDWQGLQLPLITQVQVLTALSYGDLGVVQGLTGAGDAASLIRLIPEHPVLTRFKADLINGQTVAFVDVAEDWGENVRIRKNGTGYRFHGTTKPVRLAKTAQHVVVAGNDEAGEPIICWLDDQLADWQVEEGDYRLGLLASGIARLTFTNLNVKDDQIIAKGDEASNLLSKVRTRLQILQAAKAVGLMEAALAFATEYTAGRKAFGQEIAKFQGVSFRIAEMAMEARIANHLVWQAALQADDAGKDAGGLSLRALYRAHRSLRYITDSAVQLLGGHGFVQDFPVEKWMRDAEAQVTLYGREHDLLIQRGEQLINGTKEGAVT